MNSLPGLGSTYYCDSRRLFPLTPLRTHHYHHRHNYLSTTLPIYVGTCPLCLLPPDVWASFIAYILVFYTGLVHTPLHFGFVPAFWVLPGPLLATNFVPPRSSCYLRDLSHLYHILIQVILPHFILSSSNCYLG